MDWLSICKLMLINCVFFSISDLILIDPTFLQIDKLRNFQFIGILCPIPASQKQLKISTPHIGTVLGEGCDEWPEGEHDRKASAQFTGTVLAIRHAFGFQSLVTLGVGNGPPRL